MGKKKKLTKFLSIGVFGILPLVLASCSSVSATHTLLKKSISIGDGTKVNDKISLKNYVQTALITESGIKGFLDGLAGEMILGWFEDVASNTNNFEYISEYNNQKKSVDEGWTDKVDAYKKEDSSAWAIKLQQNDLDPVGGTEEAYKNKQMTDWAVSKFKEKLFATPYLTYEDSSGNPVKYPNLSSAEALYDALSRGAFVFQTTDTNTGSSENSINIEKEYADFVQYIWDMYVQIENPYVVNMSLWKYGIPSQGISDLYLGLSNTVTEEGGEGNGSSSASYATKEGETTEGGEETPASPAAGSYTHPYFANDSANPNSGTLTKFYNFVKSASSATTISNSPSSFITSETTSNSWAIPFKMAFDTNNYGLLQIPIDYTEDSSTYILAKNGSIYNDLYPEFAAASSYLLWRNSTNGTTSSGASTSKVEFGNGKQNSGITNIDADISAKIGTPSIVNDATTGLDPITGLFVKQSKIFNNTQNGGGSTKANNGDNYQLKLSKEFVSQLINPNGSLKNIANSELYVVDSFIPSDNNLSNFMLLRNQAGVHAISIDGAYYINTKENGTNSNTITTSQEKGSSTTLTASQKKINAGQVVLFRALLNSISGKPAGYDFAIDIQSELSTFFEKNLSWLVLGYAFKNSGSQQKLFQLPKDVNESSSEIKLAKILNNYLHQINYYNQVYNYNKKLVEHKSQYSKNYGEDAKKNGFAAPWTYKNFDTNSGTGTGTGSKTTSPADRYRLNPYISFEVAATVDVVENPFTLNKTAIGGSASSSAIKNPDGTDAVTKNEVLEAINTLTNTIKPQHATFEGFKYTQYIYSDSRFVNYALITFANEGDNLANITKIAYLKDYISDVFDTDKLEFKSSSQNRVISTNASNLNKNINDFFFGSTFDASANKWDRLNGEKNKQWNEALKNGTAQSTNTNGFATIQSMINQYKKDLWKMSVENTTSASISSWYSLYATVATIKYLTESDYKNFFDYFKTRFSIGEEAYIVWEGAQNRILQSKQFDSGAELLDASKYIARNINNGFASDYLGGSVVFPEISSSTSKNTNPPITVNRNTNEKAIYSDVSGTYYNITGGMTGFKGLQTSTTNSVSSVIAERLFTDLRLNNSNNTGLLYSYENADNLKQVIQNAATLTTVNNIANSLAKKLNSSELTKIANDKDLRLAEKKEKLLNAVNNVTSNVDANYFNQRKGIVGAGENTTNNRNGLISNNTPIEYAAYAVQLNRSDISNFESLKKAIMTSSTTEATQTNTIDLTDTEAQEIIFALIVQQALRTDVQTNAINELLLNNKINAYDVRIYRALGPGWIIGWKETN